MKCLALLLAMALAPAALLGEAPGMAKTFQSGVSGLGYQWNFCREGDVVRYVVFAGGARPRELGDEKPGQWVSVVGAATRNPKATLRLGGKERRDLLAAPAVIYQIDREGKVSTYDERVTATELNGFIGSHPPQYTAEALLSFVHAQRATRSSPARE